MAKGERRKAKGERRKAKGVAVASRYAPVSPYRQAIAPRA
ncbi:conserved hypothetical protein [Burkholderia pseudomallei 305]|nr:conserved hypothetical protein [Burkholderia pseudomallei 305]